MSGKIIEETPEQTAAYARSRAGAPQNGTAPMTPEQQELAERRATRARQAEALRERWLEESGFATVIEKAEALLEDLPRALEEHRRAQGTLGDLATFLELAQEAPDDLVLQRFARGARDLAQSIASPPLLAENAGALRELIAKVRSADLGDANGPIRNGNVAAAWQRRFRELLSPLPPRGRAAECARQVKAFLSEARAAREGRS